MSIIVNADYESVLFHQKPSLKMVRELEFLGLWLKDNIVPHIDYSDHYLERISRYTSVKPKLEKQITHAENWWGKLQDLKSERFLNSKEINLNLSLLIGENFSKLIRSKNELQFLSPETTYLFKSFSGVSGRGNKLMEQLKVDDFPLIAEPLHQRELDFSSYFFSNGARVFYQNFIGPHFSYKGSFFDLHYSSQLEEMSFYQARPNLSWQVYLNNIDIIYQFVREYGDQGFSIDSYLFDGKIRTFCEINYRRTMGLSAFEISQRISPKRFSLFLIFKSLVSYEELCEKCERLEIILLSHEKNLFSYILLLEDSKELIIQKLKKLESISRTSFTIEIE